MANLLCSCKWMKRIYIKEKTNSNFGWIISFQRSEIIWVEEFISTEITGICNPLKSNRAKKVWRSVLLVPFSKAGQVCWWPKAVYLFIGRFFGWGSCGFSLTRALLYDCHLLSILLPTCHESGTSIHILQLCCFTSFSVASLIPVYVIFKPVLQTQEEKYQWPLTVR